MESGRSESQGDGRQRDQGRSGVFSSVEGKGSSDRYRQHEKSRIASGFLI